MTILSDRQIRTLCSDAYYVYQETDVFGETERRYVSEEQFRRMEHDPRSQQVLRRMKVVRGQPMISPFVGTSVRVKGGALCDPPEGTPPQDPLNFEMVSYRTPTEKIISYGCSSYGYDVRLAREFKIFTNVNSTTVDPKELDPKSFFDFEGDVCIIPPNSFILARTVERFCMPPDVVGLCVGKSTIARAGIITLCTPLEPGWEGYLTLEFANTTPLPAKMYAGEGALQIQFFQGTPCEVSYRDRGGKYQNQKPEITLPIA